MTILDKIIAKDPRNPDALNLMGFCDRKLGNTDEALEYYNKALAIKPNHVGANEYLGELYPELKNLPKAEERLKVLGQGLQRLRGAAGAQGEDREVQGGQQQLRPRGICSRCGEPDGQIAARLPIGAIDRRHALEQPRPPAPNRARVPRDRHRGSGRGRAPRHRRRSARNGRSRRAPITAAM